MQLAVQAPLSKLLAVGGATLALAIGATLPAHSHRSTHRLSLVAPVQPNAIYITAWARGAVSIVRDDAHPRAFTITSRARIPDGCTWLGIEHLEPIDALHYSYTYDETIVSCEPGATPYIKTPRTGIVTVED
jgi:hypothetical protein